MAPRVTSLPSRASGGRIRIWRCHMRVRSREPAGFRSGASTSTVAPVDVAQPSRQLTPCTRMPAYWHTWTRPQGAQPLTYGSAIRGYRYAISPQGIRVVWESRTVRFRSENPQGFGLDEHRFVIAYPRLYPFISGSVHHNTKRILHLQKCKKFK